MEFNHNAVVEGFKSYLDVWLEKKEVMKSSGWFKKEINRDWDSFYKGACVWHSIEFIETEEVTLSEEYLDRIKLLHNEVKHITSKTALFLRFLFYRYCFNSENWKDDMVKPDNLVLSDERID